MFLLKYSLSINLPKIKFYITLTVTEDELTAKTGLTLNFSVEVAYYLPHIPYI